MESFSVWVAVELTRSMSGSSGATNTSVDAAVAAGRLREDLLFRLNVVELQVPALGSRREDILPLAEYFLLQFCRQEETSGGTEAWCRGQASPADARLARECARIGESGSKGRQ